MTNDQQLSEKYPDLIDRIRELVDAGFLDKSPETRSAPNTLASAFDWAKTKEGWDFWNEVYRTR